MNKAIKVENLSKKYTLYQSNKDRMLDLISPSKKHGEQFYALNQIDFEAEAGEVVGFVGINGSGKSTLSNIIAGIVPETTGEITINGQVALIAVAAGLDNQLTGRDNIELKLLMLGFNKTEIHYMEKYIIEFAELERFIDQPVKSYSSGMKSRLGFAISISVDPDIIIIDEALSVGDKAFAEKSLEKMNAFKQDGKTMIFVSHSLGQMRQFCDKIAWLEYGTIKMFGTVDEVLPQYEAFLAMWKKLPKKMRKAYRDQVINGKLHYDSFIEQARIEADIPEYEEKLISRIGRIREGNYLLYEAPDRPKTLDVTHPYEKSTYFIKKQVVYRDVKFYLISTKESTVHGVIGWIKAADIATHAFVQVDHDEKSLCLNGLGKAYDRPWGAEDNTIFSVLTDKKGTSFRVIRTDKVGKNIWYYGGIDNHPENVWIHQNHVECKAASM